MMKMEAILGHWELDIGYWKLKLGKTNVQCRIINIQLSRMRDQQMERTQSRDRPSRILWKCRRNSTGKDSGVGVCVRVCDRNKLSSYSLHLLLHPNLENDNENGAEREGTCQPDSLAYLSLPCVNAFIQASPSRALPNAQRSCVSTAFNDFQRLL